MSLDMFTCVEGALGLPASDSAAGRDCVQLPFAGHALELGAPSFVELDPGARHKVFDRAGDDHFTGPGLGGHARADVHGDSPDLAIQSFALPRVQPRANLEAQVAHGVDDRSGAADRPRRAVEDREEAIPGGVQLAPVASVQE